MEVHLVHKNRETGIRARDSARKTKCEAIGDSIIHRTIKCTGTHFLPLYLFYSGQLAVVGVLMDSDEFESNLCLQIALDNAPKPGVDVPLDASKASGKLMIIALK